MTAVPVPRTWAAGEVITSSRLNANISDVLTFLSAPPVVEMSQTVVQSTANGSTPVSGNAATFTTEDFDSSGMHSTSVNTSRCTAVYPGLYLANGGAAFAANVTGSRGGAWAVNGTLLSGGYSWLPANGSGFTSIPMRGKLLFLGVGDYLELWLAQTSGGALNTSAASLERSHISLKWVSN
jgi:hypothetical protein